jgi:PiT family inorganic phosphate transporter
MDALGFPALIASIAIAVIFDALNGLHDAANSIATIVSTRVLRPQYAVAWAAFFNFIAFLFFGLTVAQTVGTGIVSADVVDAVVIFGALMGAISWNLLTWWLGIPSSSSHALIGGLAGAGFMKAGFGAIVWTGLGITGAAIVFSPLLGFLLALLLVLVVSWLFVRSTTLAVDNLFQVFQFVSARSIPSGMAGTTPRRPWASSPCCCFPRACWATPFTFPSGWF